VRRREIISLVGGVATWSLAARAQQKAMPVIGSLNSSAPGPAAPFVAAFIHRYAEGRYDRLPALAADLVTHKVDLIQTSGGAPAIRAAKKATSMIPNVFGSGDDPVEAGFVASLARPGGNLTGVSFLVAELHAKRFQLLRELIPQAKTIALLVNPNSANGDRVMREMQDAARLGGVQLLTLKVSTEGEIDTAFATLVRRQADGLLVQADPFINSRRDQVVALAAHHSIPAIYEFREFAAAGGLISYARTASGQTIAGVLTPWTNVRRRIVSSTSLGERNVWRRGYHWSWSSGPRSTRRLHNRYRPMGQPRRKWRDLQTAIRFAQ
jgi:putative ABC transport system substrate-binding protein